MEAQKDIGLKQATRHDDFWKDGYLERWSI